MAEIPKIVTQRLHATERARVHPDPDLITAFVEKSLGNHERVPVLEHLSRCAGCREIVSLSATQADIAGAVSVVPASSGWLSLPVLRWGAAVACVIVVGAAVTLRHQQEAPQVAPALAGDESAARALRPDSAFAKKATSLQLPDQQAKTTSVTKQIPSGPAATSGSVFAATANHQKARTASRADGNYAPVAPGPMEMADARTGSPLVQEVPGRAKSAVRESQDVTMNASTAPSSRDAGVAITPLVSTNLPPRWTLSSDGTLQRSRDSGRTWQTIPVSRNTIFRALAANGLDIWVGGSAGALFHSSDAGQHWTQMRPVAGGEPLADDIIGVEFTDLLHGKLTTSRAETWITTDAGQTWQKQ
jgi:Photosynthesis system II assembly factor YCF48